MIRSMLVPAVILAIATGCSSETDALDAGDRFRVINGDPAPDSVAQYAATVGIHSREGDAVTVSPYCSGVLIDPEVVLTAAHCCDSSRGPIKARPVAPEAIAIYFGEGPAFLGDTLTGEFYAASEVAVHPNYSPLSITNDICLIRLASQNTNSPTVPHLPASLGLSDADAGTLIDHVGFGYSDLDKTEFGRRLHAELPLAGLGCVVDGCPSEATEAQFSYVQDGDPHTGTCNGDSGGPNFITRDGTVYVAGVTSYGDAGCTLYGVSTNVSAYQSFIDGFIGGATPSAAGECGNGSCDPMESCDGRNGSVECPTDCPGQTKGKPSTRYCQVGSSCEGPACP